MSDSSQTFDRTLRRAPDPEATLRREDLQETLRREDAPADSGADAPPEGAAPPGQEIPCEIDGRRSSLRVDGTLGTGGEGELYLCRRGDDAYVTKILRHDSDIEVLSAMVRRKADLEKRHLVPCLYIGNMSEVAGSALDRRTYIVHPFYAGGDLASPANARRINPSIRYDGDEKTFRPCAECYINVHCDYAAVDEDAFTYLVGQLADGLRALHEASFAPGTTGAVHRDIKPQNIFAGTDGQYVLGDFGLISAMSTGSPMKFTQRIGLSHGYSPPEAYSDRAFKQTVTRKYDYFSLGMTLLHIAGGRPRYIIDDDLARSTSFAVTLADFYETIMLSAVSVPEQLPRRIRSLLRGLLAADPDERWGEREVSAWLDGEDPLVPGRPDSQPEDISLRIYGRTEKGARAVSAALVRSWNMCADMAVQGELVLDWDDPDPVYRSEVEHALDMAAFAAPDIALQTIVLTICRQMGHVFRGQRFETDEALGAAMTRAAAEPDSEQFALLRDYLVLHGLSNTWNLAGGPRSDAVFRTLLRLEENAHTNPAAAMYAAGALLSGTPVPPVTVRLGIDDVTFSSGGDVAEWTERELEECAGRCGGELLDEQPPRIPGCWQAGDEETVRQIDGSVLLDTARVLEPLPVSGALLSAARILLQPGNTPEERDSSARLRAMLCADGYIADVSCAQMDALSAPDGFMPWILVQFLALFPQARTKHTWDELLQKMLRTTAARLTYISGVKTPCSSGTQRIDAEVSAVRSAASQYARTADFTDFAEAVQQANRSRAVLAGLRPLNYELAQRIVTMMPSVLSTDDPDVHTIFDAVCGEWAKTPGNKEDLAALSTGLDGVESEIARFDRSDLSAYLLSDTMLFIRNYNQTSQQPLDILLPDTTDADAYYEALRTQVQHKRAKLLQTGLVDEDGNILR